MFDKDHPLQRYWHPIALSSDVGDKPKAARLLGVDIVLWRTEAGVRAFEDLCIHRGTRLSLGWVEKGELVCPYHGWCYGADGVVTKIPSVPPERAIPARARVAKYHCEERYGLVFVCLGDPIAPIYEMPPIVGPGHHRHIVGPIYWKTGAARSLENFLDEAHLPWAHHGFLGNRNNVPVIPQREVTEDKGAFSFECQSECSTRVEGGGTTINTLTYEVVLPFTIFHVNRAPDGTEIVDLFLTAPVDETMSVRFMVVWRNYALDTPDENFVNFSLEVWEQDRPLVENQRPELVPLDLSEELHLRGPDGPAIVYRRMLSEIGIKEAV